jgi:AcrR family transcriptional regulator
MTFFNWPQMLFHITEMEQQGLVTSTFRRLNSERQLAVITAIFDEAVEKGPTSLNIKQVAKRSDVSVGSLYTYFNNRDGLLMFATELCVRFMNDMFNVGRPFLTAVPFAEGLASYVTTGIEWSRAQTGLLQFFARAAYHSDSELSDQVVRPIADNLRAIVQDMIRNAINRGEVRPDIDVEATARLVYALTVAVGDSQILPYLNAYFQVTSSEVTRERIVKALVNLIMNGIGTRPGQGSPPDLSR